MPIKDLSLALLTIVVWGLNFAVINVAFEAERLGDNTTLSAKVGWRF